MLVVVAAVVGGLFVWRSVASGDGGRHAAAQQFLTGWARRDWAAMWQALTPSARTAYPQTRFAAAYRSADRAAGVRWVRVGKLGGDHDGEIAVPVWVGTVTPKDSDAWFVAFAPAQHPKVAVAIMLVAAGFGGTSAAPIARHVLQAALAPS